MRILKTGNRINYVKVGHSSCQSPHLSLTVSGLIFTVKNGQVIQHPPAHRRTHSHRAPCSWHSAFYHMAVTLKTLVSECMCLDSSEGKIPFLGSTSFDLDNFVELLGQCVMLCTFSQIRKLRIQEVKSLVQENTAGGGGW